MSSDKDNRKDCIQAHLETLQRGVDDIKESKSILKTAISNSKESLGHLEHTEEKLSLNIELIQSIDAGKTNECDHDTWQNYQDVYDDDKKSLCIR